MGIPIHKSKITLTNCPNTANADGAPNCCTEGYTGELGWRKCPNLDRRMHRVSQGPR